MTPPFSSTSTKAKAKRRSPRTESQVAPATDAPKNAQKQIGLAEVASEAGVSVSTVSAVLGNRKYCYASKKTRERVHEAAKRLNYRPNVFARGLRGGTTQTIGVISTGLASSWVGNAQLQSIERAAQSQGFRVLYGSYEPGPQLVEQHVRDFRGLSIDGLVYWAGQSEADTTIQKVADEGTPVVVIDPEQTFAGPTVRTEREIGGYMQIKHLHEIGRRKLAFLYTGVLHYKTHEKMSGIRRGMAEFGLKLDERLCISRQRIEGSPPQTGRQMVDELLATNLPFDALVTLSDGVALGALHRMIQRDIKVPQDVAVIGFDDDLYASATFVPLTTIHQPRDIGHQVIDLLQRQMPDYEKETAEDSEGVGGSGGSSMELHVEPHLVVRDSTVAD